MKIELSERSRQLVESLVEDGAYPTPEAAVEAAIEQIADPWAGIDVAALAEQARRSRAEGTFRELNDRYEAELRAKLEAIIAPHRPPA